MRDAARPARWLTYAAGFFLVGSAWHNADHFRRGTDSVTTELLWAGTLGMIVSAVAILTVLTRHRLAPVVATVGGFTLAIGFAGAHWLPDWGPFSDSFVDGDPELVSQLASLMEIAGALGLGIAGLVVLRADRAHAV